jgi:hypothetical protein
MGPIYRTRLKMEGILRNVDSSMYRSVTAGQHDVNYYLGPKLRIISMFSVWVCGPHTFIASPNYNSGVRTANNSFTQEMYR